MAAAVLAAAFLFLTLPVPPPAAELSPRDAPLVLAGSLHVHTNRSDGSGSVDEVAAAAARAGLQFVVLTDHGDGTRTPDPPRYVSGVLVIDAVELSTQSGHYIAVGLPSTPYPLRGDARDVADDVRRLGGFGIVAHPDSAKPGLRWHDWDVHVDGIEWLNADTEWRDERRSHLARALLRYSLRPAETLGSLLDRPDATLTRWDRLTRERPIVAVAGADAHARVGWRDDDVNGYRHGWFVKIPSYVASFQTFSIRVQVRRVAPDDAAQTAREIISALKDGRVYTAIDAVAAPAFFTFSLTDSVTSTEMGGVSPRPGVFTVQANAPAGSMIVLRRDGAIIDTQPAPELSFPGLEVGTYRAEVLVQRAPGRPPVPWIVSNPIYLRPEGWGRETAAAPHTLTTSRDIQGGPWHVEKDDGSTASASQPDHPAGPVTFTFGLAAGERRGQYAALAISIGRALADADRLAFHVLASRPMRVSVQARQPQTGARWQRSIYVDATRREVVVPLSDFRSVGSAGALDPSSTDSLLFVVDTVNTLPGTNGTLTIGGLKVGR